MTGNPRPPRRARGRQALQRAALIVAVVSLFVVIVAYAVQALTAVAIALLLLVIAVSSLMAGARRLATERASAQSRRAPHADKESEMFKIFGRQSDGEDHDGSEASSAETASPGPGAPDPGTRSPGQAPELPPSRTAQSTPPQPSFVPAPGAQSYDPQSYDPRYQDPGYQDPGRYARHSPARSYPPAPSAPAATAADPFDAPPVFLGTSDAGQASWHLPEGSVSSGLSADAARLGDLEVRAASVIGASHRCQEPAGPRQDAYSLRRSPDGQFLIVAVADGVGSSPHSDIGARVAVTAATRLLEGMLKPSGFSGIDVSLLYKKVAGEMIGTGRSRDLAEKDICSILITAVIPARAEPNGYRTVWAASIGDVSLWLVQGGRLHQFTGHEKSGLDRNALDAVLPFDPGKVRETSFFVAPGDRLALMTDGVSDTLTTVPDANSHFARRWSGAPPHPAAFLRDLCYDSPGQGDDRTAVVVWCGNGTPPAPANPATEGPRA